MRRGIILLDAVFLYVIPSEMFDGDRRVAMHDDRRGRIIFTRPAFIRRARVPISFAPCGADAVHAASLSLVNVYFFSATVSP